MIVLIVKLDTTGGPPPTLHSMKLYSWLEASVPGDETIATLDIEPLHGASNNIGYK